MSRSTLFMTLFFAANLIAVTTAHAADITPNLSCMNGGGFQHAPFNLESDDGKGVTTFVSEWENTQSQITVDLPNDQLSISVKDSSGETLGYLQEPLEATKVPHKIINFQAGNLSHNTPVIFVVCVTK